MASAQDEPPQPPSTAGIHVPTAVVRPVRRATPDSKPHFLGELGFAVHHRDERVFGAVMVTPEVCTPGTEAVRTGVLCTLADIVAGRLAASLTAPSLSVTVDLAYTVLASPPREQLVAEARVLKAGRTTIVTETRYYAGEGHPDEARRVGASFAICLGTFVASRRPSDLLPTTPESTLPIAGNGVPTLGRPVLERLGSIESAPGILDTELAPDIVNSAGALQGGAVALLADGAAQSAASAVAERTCTVWDLDVRYLGTLRVGPVRTSAHSIGELPDGTSLWRVELRDIGNNDRLGAVAVARCRV